MVKRILFVVAALGLAGALGTFLYVELEPPDTCEVCYRPLHEETFYQIHLTNGDTREVCCPRCGLRFQEAREDVLRAEVADFYTKERIDARTPFYVENSSVHLCSASSVQADRSGTQYEVAWDRCLPSLIAFESRKAAEGFQQQNGGVIKDYDELLAERD